MVPTPWMRRLVTAALLGCVLGGAPAGADGGLSCRDCVELPEE